MLPSRACEVALDRARRAGAAVIAVTADRARREAARSDERLRTGDALSALDGVPILWKDVFDVTGTVTTLGSASRLHHAAALTDSALVRRATRLGAVTVGKTNLSEFAFSGLGINRRFGTPVNPVDPTRVPGGSSSGAAVAVATGITPLAVGTDTSGSVRVPAAFTGCVGYRASRHRYGCNDFHPLSPSLDSVGVIARTVERISVFDRAFASDRSRADNATAVRVVVPAGEMVDDCSVGVAASFAAAVDLLRADGAIVVATADLPSLHRAQSLLDTHGTIVGAEAHRQHRHRLAHHADIEPATRRRLIASSRFEDTVDAVRRAMSDLRRQFAAELNGALLLCPTVRHEPPRIADLLASDDVYDAVNASTLRTTMVLSYLGTCGVSLPSDDPSIGVLLSAPDGDDRRLLDAAARVEAALR